MMVVESDEYEDYDEVEFRNNNKEPCSVSEYGDIESKAAHDALVQASQDLLPLADYIEQNYSQDSTGGNGSNQQLNGLQEEEG